MSTNTNKAPEEQEIDLSQISKRIGNFFENVSNKIFRGILFLKRNLIAIAVLFITGAALGFYIDKKTKIYDHQIIVTPNFGSGDYMYSKIAQISSKINEGDTLFLKEVVGIKEPKRLNKISINPIIDVYKFIENRTEYFELLKLMAENGDISKIIEDDVTSKNYAFHEIVFSTNKTTDLERTVQPIVNYLNKSDYFEKVRATSENNIKVKMAQNDSLIQQINGLLNGLSGEAATKKSNSIVYINQNTQLNDVIKTKDALIAEQGYQRLELLKSNNIIKDVSTTLNIRQLAGTNGKMKVILPFLFILLFLLGGLFKSYYQRQMTKQNFN